MAQLLHAAHLIRFLEVMRGTRMAPPTKLLPVTKMPLHPHATNCWIRCPMPKPHPPGTCLHESAGAYHDAPRIDVPTHRATPVTAQK
jgi:hypothetical protein